MLALTIIACSAQTLTESLQLYIGTGLLCKPAELCSTASQQWQELMCCTCTELEAKHKAAERQTELRRVLDSQRQEVDAKRAAELAQKAGIAQQQVSAGYCIQGLCACWQQAYTG